MAEKSSIEWTDASWNPVTGCTEVSPGCDRCYARVFAERFRGVPGHHFEHGFDLRLWPDRLTLPLRWKRPRRIFVNSVADLFHQDIPTEFIGPLTLNLNGIAWVIAGAESGRGARPMHEDWVRSLRDQATLARAAFFYKQNTLQGRKVPLPMLDGVVWNEFPDEHHPGQKRSLEELAWNEKPSGTPS